jgi:hypothetical protein
LHVDGRKSSDDRPPCLENPRPAGAESTLTENVASPFHAEPRQEDKETEHIQIDECVHKLPKALLDLASRAEGGRHLFFPVALFAGQMFAVSYSGKLVVTEVPHLQYYVSFEKEVYHRKLDRTSTMGGFSSLVPSLIEMEEQVKEIRQAKIRDAARSLSFPYQIDFVTEAGLPDYLAIIEKQIDAVRTVDWLVPESPKPGLAGTDPKGD